MEYRNWNKNGARTSLLGFGCMRFPTNADGSIDGPKPCSTLQRPPV